MSVTSHIPSPDAGHSFVIKKPSEKHDAPNRMPRPPNAFILYRSDFLRRGAVPPEVEKRQQNLSRIAGQCWNMLPESEKEVWYSKAADIRAEYRAKYPFHRTGSFHKNTSKPSTRDKKSKDATKSGRSFSRLRSRRTRTSCSQGMFATPHASVIPSPVSQATLVSPTLASESPLSTAASLSPSSLPELLSPFSSPTHSSKRESPSATFDSPVIRKDKFGYPLDSPGSEPTQWVLPGIIHGSGITPSEIGSSRQSYHSIQQHGDDFALGTSYPSFEQLFEPLSNSFIQSSPSLRGSNIFPTVIGTGEHSASFLLSNDSSKDSFTHFNQSFVPLYSWNTDDLDISE